MLTMDNISNKQLFEFTYNEEATYSANFNEWCYLNRKEGETFGDSNCQRHNNKRYLMLNMVPRNLAQWVRGSKSRRRRDFSRNRACFVVRAT